MFTKWIKEQLLIEQIQHVLVLVRFDNLLRNSVTPKFPTAYEFQSALFIQYLQKCRIWYSYKEKF